MENRCDDSTGMEINLTRFIFADRAVCDEWSIWCDGGSIIFGFGYFKVKRYEKEILQNRSRGLDQLRLVLDQIRRIEKINNIKWWLIIINKCEEMWWWRLTVKNETFRNKSWIYYIRMVIFIITSITEPERQGGGGW